MMRKARMIVAGAVVVATIGGGWLISRGDPQPTAGPDPGGRGPIVGEGLDLLSGSTAEDWVRYASFVATVSVVDERAASIPKEDLERGEGMVDRVIDIRIDRTLWSRPGVTPPTTVTTTAAGWTWGDGDPGTRTAFALADRPRLEVGRQYVVAFASYPGLDPAQAERCGDPATPTRWGPVGSGGAVPVTDGVVGVGEFEGADRDLDQALAASKEARSGPDVTFRDLVTGASVQVVPPLLDEAARRTPPTEVPGPPGC